MSKKRKPTLEYKSLETPMFVFGRGETAKGKIKVEVIFREKGETKKKPGRSAEVTVYLAERDYDEIDQFSSIDKMDDAKEKVKEFLQIILAEMNLR